MLWRPGSGFPIDSQVRLPMMTGWPIVTRLKWAISSGSLHGKALSRPITRLRAMATTSERIIECFLDRDRRLDRGEGVVALDGDVLEAEREQVVDRGIQAQLRKRSWRSCQ